MTTIQDWPKDLPTGLRSKCLRVGGLSKRIAASRRTDRRELTPWLVFEQMQICRR